MSNIPLMSDGRNFSTWEQPINMDLYLQNNANHVLKNQHFQYKINFYQKLILILI
jgi:hypothetical protein